VCALVSTVHSQKGVGAVYKESEKGKRQTEEGDG
jgi:hypothetical protein